MITDRDPGDEQPETDILAESIAAEAELVARGDGLIMTTPALTLPEVESILADTARRAREDRYSVFRHGGRPR